MLSDEVRLDGRVELAPQPRSSADGRVTWRSLWERQSSCQEVACRDGRLMAESGFTRRGAVLPLRPKATAVMEQTSRARARVRGQRNQSFAGMPKTS